MAFSTDGRLAALTDGHGRVELWDVAAAKAVRALPVPDAQGNARGVGKDLAFSQNADRLALWAADGTVLVWNTATGKLEHRFLDEDMGGSSLLSNLKAPTGSRLRFSPDGDYLATVTLAGGKLLGDSEVSVIDDKSSGSAIRLWHLPTGRRRELFPSIRVFYALSPFHRTAATWRASMQRTWWYGRRLAAKSATGSQRVVMPSISRPTGKR